MGHPDQRRIAKDGPQPAEEGQVGDGAQGDRRQEHPNDLRQGQRQAAADRGCGAEPEDRAKRDAKGQRKSPEQLGQVETPARDRADREIDQGLVLPIVSNDGGSKGQGDDRQEEPAEGHSDDPAAEGLDLPGLNQSNRAHQNNQYQEQDEGYDETPGPQLAAEAETDEVEPGIHAPPPISSPTR